MLNGFWLNGAPLNEPGALQRKVLLAVNATASASIAAPSLYRKVRLGADATASAALDVLSLIRRRGLAVNATATAVTVGEVSVEIDGVLHAYLSVNATAGATIEPPALTCLCPLAVDATAGAQAQATLFRKVALRANAAASGGIDPPHLHAFVNLGALPPGQDSIIGTQRIRAFAFVSAGLVRKRALSVNATATATMSPAPRLRNRRVMAVNATAGVTAASGDDAPDATLYVRKRLSVDATAGATMDSVLLYTYVRLGVNATAGCVSTAELYMNIFDQAPIERTVRVRFNPRVVVLPPPRRTTDA